MSKAFAATEQKFKENIEADMESLWNDPQRRYLHQYKSGPIILGFHLSPSLFDAVSVDVTLFDVMLTPFPITVTCTVNKDAPQAVMKKVFESTAEGFIRELKVRGYTFLEES